MNSLNQSLHRSDQDRYKMILIPAELLDIVKEKLGDEFIWDYDKKSQELFLMKRPESNTDTDFLSGLGKDMWSSVGGEEHIHGERQLMERLIADLKQYSKVAIDTNALVFCNSKMQSLAANLCRTLPTSIPKNLGRLHAG